MSSISASSMDAGNGRAGAARLEERLNLDGYLLPWNVASEDLDRMLVKPAA